MSRTHIAVIVVVALMALLCSAYAHDGKAGARGASAPVRVQGAEGGRPFVGMSDGDGAARAAEEMAYPPAGTPRWRQ